MVLESNVITKPISQPAKSLPPVTTSLQSNDEPHYQVPKSLEPYYEVPKSKPIPLYENVEIFYPVNTTTNNRYGFEKTMEPPKEKPPPPPPMESNLTDEDDNGGNDVDNKMNQKNMLPLDDPMKRVNSTKRIKKEIRNKRTSFLGIDGIETDELEFSIAPPPDIAAIIQEERRLEKQLYNIKIGLDSSEEPNTSSSENHSRQCSDLMNSSEEPDDDYVTLRQKNDDNINSYDNCCPDVYSNTNLYENFQKKNGIENVPISPAINYGHQIKATVNRQLINNDLETKHKQHEIDRMRNLENQISEQEEVLRVERELLQLEEKELKRQHEQLLLRENMARKELENRPKVLVPVANCQSLQNINMQCNNNLYVNIPNTRRYNNKSNNVNHINTNNNIINHRQSMPNLPEAVNQFGYDIQKRLPPPIPPAKPLRLAQVAAAAKINHMQHQQQQKQQFELINNQNKLTPVGIPVQHQKSIDDYVQIRSQQQINHSNTHHYSNMSRHTLHALSAAPKPKLQDEWVHQQIPQQLLHRNSRNDYVNIMPMAADQNCIGDKFDNTKDFIKTESWNNNNNNAAGKSIIQSKRNSEPQNFYYNKHWLLQEAEQLRQQDARPSTNGWIQRKGKSDNKPLPDAIIQTLTQRVLNRLPDRKRLVINIIIYNY